VETEILIGHFGRLAETCRKIVPMEPIATDLTDPAALVEAIDRHRREEITFRTRLEGGEVEERDGMLRFVSGYNVWWTNGVLGSVLTPRDADERIAWAMEPFRERGLPSGWWVGAAPRPSDLGRRLEALGLRHHEELPWLGRDLRESKDLEDVSEVPGLSIEQVVDGPSHARWLRAMVGGFDLAPDVERFISESALRSGFGPEGRWLRFVGMVGAEPVASAGLIVAADVAGVYNVSTTPAYRRRGIAAAMTAAALREAARLGYGVAVLGSTEMATPLYRRIGFRDVCTVSAYVFDQRDKPSMTTGHELRGEQAFPRTRVRRGHRA
jgi:ribosomal protein S18 acetylase RimI-like enzyme